MEKYKIFEVNENYHVLTTTRESAKEIVIDEQGLDQFEVENMSIKECNYNDTTWQPLNILKNIFTENELEYIENQVKDSGMDLTIYKNGVNYYFDYCEWEYVGVLISFDQILNNLEILKEFDMDTIISQSW